MTRMGRLWWAGCLAVAGLLAACGGGSSSGDGQVRLLNMTRTHTTVDLKASSGSTTTTVASGVAQRAVSSYGNVSAGSVSLLVTDGGSSNSLVSTSPTVTKGNNYTLVAYESSGVVKTAWLAENETQPASGSGYLRVVSLAGDAGAVDVYVTAATVALGTGVSPNWTLAASSSVQSTSLTSFSPATWRIRVTGAGNPADVRMDMTGVVLGSQQVVNVLLLPTSGGGLIDGAALVQQGSLATAPNQQARVRVVSGLAGGTVAVSTAAGTSVQSAAVSPNIGSYVNVSAGATTFNVSVNGAALSSATATLAAGSDSTLLVTGTAAAPQSALINDLNNLPLSGTTDSIRLVNGMAGTTSGLSMSVDFSQVANNITPGTSSAYATISAGNNLRLEVNSPLSVTPVSLQTGLSIAGGGVFSVFVLGDASAPVTVIRRDR